MATKLLKPIYRETEINGIAYILSLDPDLGLTYRKKGSRGAKSVSATPLHLLVDASPSPEPVAAGHDMIAYADLKSRLSAIPETKNLMSIVDDVYEVNLLTSDLSDEEIKAKGVSLPE